MLLPLDKGRWIPMRSHRNTDGLDKPNAYCSNSKHLQKTTPSPPKAEKVAALKHEKQTDGFDSRMGWINHPCPHASGFPLLNKGGEFLNQMLIAITQNFCGR